MEVRNIELIKRGEKKTILIPRNVTQLQYNDFVRDFEGYSLDFGKVRFAKSEPRVGVVPLRCIFIWKTESPYWYLLPVSEAPTGAMND